MTHYLRLPEVLVMHGAHLTADGEQTYACVAGLYEGEEFSFDSQVPWLRENVIVLRAGKQA